MRKNNPLILLLLLGIFMIIPFVLQAQNQNESQISVRTLHVDWYMYSVDGVKLQYRTYTDEPVILYLPSSFEDKFYRFVEAPKGSGSTQGLPILIVHLKGKEVVFVDIYTRYEKQDGLIANFTAEDLKKFKEAEAKGKIELKF